MLFAGSAVLLFFIIGLNLLAPVYSNAQSSSSALNDVPPVTIKDPAGALKYSCGSASQKVNVSIDIGCHHKGNPIVDVVFAIIRLLSIGVGIVVVLMVVIAGIQYSASQGDPNATAKAIARVRNALIGLLLYIFMYALLNWIIPAGIF